MILANLTENLVSGFTLGLLTGTTCFATCGPIYTPFLMQRKLNIFQSLFMILEISAGRFVSYILFGLAAGLLGRSISSFSEHKALFTAIAYVAFSVMLIMSAFNSSQKEKGCAVSKWGKFANAPFLLGIVTGINFCPSFLIALTNAVSLNGPLSGAVLFFGFYMGTNIYLLPLSLFGVMGNQKVFRKIAMIASIVVGGYFIYKAGDTIMQLLERRSELSSKVPVLSVLHDDVPLFILAGERDSVEILAQFLEEKREAPVSVVRSEDALIDSCYILVSPFYDSLVIEKANAIRSLNRFVIVLPTVDSTGMDSSYSENIIKYLDKYYFKKDIREGTFFNMSRLREKKVKLIPYDTTQNSESEKNGEGNEKVSN